MARVLELKNGPLIHEKIRAPENRLGKLLAQKLRGPQIVEELFLATLSRSPSPQELKATLDVVDSAADPRAGWESVLWALLNTNEFFLRY